MAPNKCKCPPRKDFKVTKTGEEFWGYMQDYEKI